MRNFVQNSAIAKNIKATLEDQPTAVKVLVLLTLAAIVLAAAALFIGLLSGATAAVFLSAPLVAPKTRRDYFDELPEPYRSQAFENTRQDWAANGYTPTVIEAVLSLPCTGLEDAFKGAFVFKNTPEGHLYWDRAANGVFDAPEGTKEPTRAKIERILWIALILLTLFGFFYMVGHTVELVLSLATVLPATRNFQTKNINHLKTVKMRKITIEAAAHFEAGMTYGKSNTTVKVEGDRVEMFLHGNLIARREKGTLQITMAGWETPTTRERLNGIPGVYVNQHKGEQYLNGKRWTNTNQLTPIK